MSRKKRAFPRESKGARYERARQIAKRLFAEYPGATVELEYRDPLQLLVATILSAQCTDERVNMVTPPLFEKYPDAGALAGSDREDLERMIHSTGFFRQKARSIQEACRVIVEEHSGEVPRDMDALTSLPGVGRKTANVVRGGAWGMPGVTVDTHVKRLSRRMGITSESDPVKIEYDINEMLPEEWWFDFSSVMIRHGRRVCFARKPDCPACVVRDKCRFYLEEVDGQKSA
jgi:endonuclease-3